MSGGVRTERRVIKGLVSLAGCGLLAGCAGTMTFPDAGTGSATAEQVTGALKGNIHGGQQPIVGAKIYLYAAGTSAYGGASTSLLKSTGAYAGYPVTADGNGNYYVTTDANGNFQIADTCTSGQQVYIASIGGNPGAGTNTAANEIAILGQCPSSGSFDSSLSNVFISEISTVAAAYAVSAYAVDTTHIGGPSSTTLQTTAIANAFANAANLFDVTNINDLARTATISGNGTVPQSKIHTLANIIAACVNSTGSSSSACSTLFADAKNAAGTLPTDTTAAAINIAHNPSANVSGLYALMTSTAPFYPRLSSAPNDFALPLTFTSASLGNNPSMSMDASGDLWMGAAGTGALMELSPLGKLLSTGSGFSTGSTVTDVRAIAVANSGDIFVLGKGTSNSVPVTTGAEMSSAGKVEYSYSESSAATATHPPPTSTNLALDASSNIYFSAVKNSGGAASTTCCTMKFNAANEAITELDSGKATPGTNFLAASGSNLWITSNASSVELYTTAATVLTGGGLNGANGVAVDSSGNAWFANSGNSTISEFNSSGTAVTSTAYSGGGLSTPKAIAIDGASTVWLTNSSGSYGLSQFTSAGAAVGTGYATPGLTSAGPLVLDASGDVWVGDASSTTVLEYIGLAAPVVTPLATAVYKGTLGTKP